MFDIQATIKWITGVLQDPPGTASAYREISAGWQQSFMQLALPAYAAAYVVALIVAFITGGSFPYGSLSVGVFVFTVLWALGWTFVMALIFDFLAGTFGGQRNFDAAYALVALAIIPAAAGSALGPIPWIGWLISLAASIYSLVLAYRFIPIFLEVPEAARTKHFAVSVIVAIVINLVVGVMFGSMFAPSIQRAANQNIDRSSEGIGSGLFGGLERQAGFADAAARDTYDPPADGRLNEDQVKTLLDVLTKTRILQERLSKSVESMEDKEPSLTDIFDGVGGVVRLSTAEMEVVKTAGGNWAEHQWVRSQIETARVQQDLNDTTEYNYRLFEQYQTQIEQFD